jgi:membrane-bound ClpP family serine protease
MSTILFGLKLLALAHMDFDAGDELADSSFTFLSLQSILAFFMGFGWAGSTCAKKEYEMSSVVVILISVAAGTALLFLSVWLMSLVKKLNFTPKVDLNSAIGRIGTAYTRMRPNGTGKVRIELNGKVSIFNAKNSTTCEINAFERVKIIAVKDGVFDVEKI